MPQMNDSPAHGRQPAPARPALPADQRALLRQLDETLGDAGIYVAAEIREGVVYLAGEVDSVENRQAALDVATALAEPAGLAVEDDLDMSPSAPDEAFAGSSAQYGTAYGYVDPDTDDDGELDPEFARDPDFTGDIGTRDAEEAAAEAMPYYPPTDPVTETTSDQPEAELVRELREPDEEGNYLPWQDDDIRQAVLDELAHDALTQELQIQVVVVNGVVALRGTVPRLEDAENAEAVASRVPDVRDIREQLTVLSLRER